MNWKTKVEQKFEKLSDLIFDNRLKVIFLISIIVVAMASQMRYITFDTSTEGFLHKEDPLIIDYNKFRDQFGRDEKILIAISSDDIFSMKFLTKLNKLHKELENNLPYIQEVNSLINARNTRGDKESLIVDDLFKELPKNQKELLFKKELAQNNPLLKDLLIDKTGTITTIIIDTNTYSSIKNSDTKISQKDEFAEENSGFDDDNIGGNKEEKRAFLTNEENTQIVTKTNQIVSKYQSDDFKILVSGSAVIGAELKLAMKKDMGKFIRLVFIAIVILLALLFRRISGVVLPMVVVALTIVSTLSMMSIFGAPITVITQILPSFLLAVTVGASMHLLSIFFKEFDTTKDKKASIRYAMGHSGLAIVMTSLTTAAGLWSFSFSELAPVADLGVFASAGIIVGLLFTLILLPALLSIMKIKPKNIADNGVSKYTLMDKMLLKISSISTSYPKTIISITTILIFLSIAISSQLRFSHKPVVWFDKEHPVRKATDMIDAKMNGSNTMEIVVDTKTENGLYNPKILNAIDEFSKDVLTIKSDKYYVGKTLSIVDIIKETNKALNENKKEFYTIPDDKNLIAQELFLFSNSGSDDLEDFVDSGFTKAKITIKLPNIDAIDYIVLLKEINDKLDKHLSSLADITTTGMSVLLARIMEAAIFSSAISYVIALVLITIMMLFLIGDIKIGLVSMIPNISPILIMTSLMVLFDMPLDMFTMLIGAIAIGLAVDDTVHFMHNFKKYDTKYKDVNKAVEMTLLSTGRAMLITTIVLSLSFFVFMGSSMNNIFNFGLLTGVAIIVALLADFFLVPALMKVIIKR